MTEVQAQTNGISIYPVRSPGSLSVASSSSSSFGSVRREMSGGLSALSDALERLLSDEQEQNAEQIASLAVKTGIPSPQRAAAWPLLLRSHPFVVDPCIANDFPVAPEGFSEKRVQGDLRRLIQKTCRQLDGEAQAALFENLRACVCQFLNKYSLQYESGFAWMAWSLYKCMGVEELDATVYEHAMLVFLHTKSTAQPRGPGENDNAESISQFMAVFRQFLPELSAHFDQEFMLNFFLGEEWLMWWMKWFGAKAFALPDLARTWDVYFGYRPVPADTPATPLAVLPNVAVDPRKLQIFVCLALMKANSHKLMELDQSEAHHLLTHVPPSRNFEAVLVEAYGMLQKSERGEVV